MSPVHYPAFFVPLILTGKRYPVTFFKAFDPWRDIDIVGDQNRLSIIEAQDKSLMPAAARVVLEQGCHHTRALHRNITEPVFKCLGKFLGGPGDFFTRVTGKGPVPAIIKGDKCKNQQQNDNDRLSGRPIFFSWCLQSFAPIPA